MDDNKKLLIQLRTSLNIYKNIDKMLDKVLNAKLDVEDLSSEIYYNIKMTETELENLKMEMNLSDDEWNEDEN